MSPLNYSHELEQRVLETLMHFGVHTSEEVQKAFLKLSTDVFYKPEHAILFSMIKEQFKKEEGFNFVDILVLIPRGNNELHGELSWIIDNYGKFPHGASSFQHDIRRLLTLSQLRKQLTTLEIALREVKECRDAEDAQNLLIEKMNEVSNITYRESKFGTSNIELAEAFYDGQLEQDLIIPTTCDQLNQALNGGIRAKSLVTVAAGAGVGKTGFAIYLMDSIARTQEGSQCLFFSIEMEARHIWMRHVGICAGKQFEKLNYDERLSAVTKSMQVPVKVYDIATCRAADDIDFILTTARLKAMEQPISVIVVDYLGLVENRGKFERNDLKQSDIVTKLSKLAIELNCVVIALSQINRASAARAVDDRCPWPHDAADSSGSHRSSALWLGVDRPELYQDDPQYQNQFVVKCRKNRFGSNFELLYGFNEGTFGKYSPPPYYRPFAPKKTKEEELFA